jgi:hypothetical protein
MFDMTGMKLYTRTAKWGVTAFNVPNSPRAGSGRPRSYRTRRWQPVTAVGRVGRAIALISAEDKLVYLEYCRQAPIKLPPGYYTAGDSSNVLFTPSADDGPLTPCFSLPWCDEMAAVDAAGSLFRFSPSTGDVEVVESKLVAGTVHLIATNVLAVNVADSRLVYVGHEWPDNQFRIVSIGGGAVLRATTLEEKARRAFFGPPASLPHFDFGLIALEQTDSQWLVIGDKEQHILLKPGRRKVFGVLIDTHSGSEPGLLALEDNFQTVTLNGHNWRKEILQAHAPVEHIALCQRAPYIAYATVNGEIVVYSVRHGADLCRYLVEGEE